MNLYLLARNGSGRAASWCDYRGFVVVAKDEDEAYNYIESFRLTDDDNTLPDNDDLFYWLSEDSWPVDRGEITITYLGEAASTFTRPQIILADNVGS